MNIGLHSFKTSVGTIRVAADDKHLLYVALPGESISVMKSRLKVRFPDSTFDEAGTLCRKAEKQITEYLNGKRSRFELPYALFGTPFQQKALKAVARIPYGGTRTYGEVAQSVGSPGSARAVGAANAQNNLPLVVPCHRVVASAGLGGYGGGLKLKSWLLKMESNRH